MRITAANKSIPLNQAIRQSFNYRMATRLNNACCIFFSILSLTGLVACSTLSGLRQAPAGTPFVPPTIAASPPPTPTLALAMTPLPTVTPICQNNLTYLSDLTIPDGSEEKPGATIDKRWQVENSGTCNWDEHYHLKLINDQALGAPEDQALYPARAGTKATIRILFTAPTTPGAYRSAWQAYAPDGQPFGDPIYIQITVK